MFVSFAMGEHQKTALVTGVLGFIGSHLADALLAKGFRVIGADLIGGSFEFFDRRVIFVPTDLTDPASVDYLCKNNPADEVYHTASVFSYGAPPHILKKVNIDGTRNLYQAIAKMKGWEGRLKAIVHWSSASINGRRADGKPADEDDPVCPANNYERSKTEQETLVRSLSDRLHLPTIFLRPAGVYGPRSRYGLAKIIELIAKGLVRCFIGNPRARQSMVHVYDVVGAAIWLGANPQSVGKTYNVTDDTLYQSGELTRHLVKTFKKWFVPIRLPLFAIRPVVRLSEVIAKLTGGEPFLIRDLLDHLESPFFVSNVRLQETGYQFRFADTKKGLDQTIAWYREKGWL